MVAFPPPTLVTSEVVILVQTKISAVIQIECLFKNRLATVELETIDISVCLKLAYGPLDDEQVDHFVTFSSQSEFGKKVVKFWETW